MHHFLLALTLAAMPLLSQAIEEPDYEVIRKFDNVELRRYAPYVVAEVVLDTSAEDAGSQAFPILAGYIFGKNKGEKKLAMTAPVTQTAAPVRMDMTAPVTQAAVGGRMQVQFVLPKGLTLATAPEPIDPRVQLRVMPAAAWAVIRYSGTWSQSNYREHLAVADDVLLVLVEQQMRPQRLIDVVFMRGLQTVERAPVHPLWLAAVAVQNTCLPAQPIPQFIRLAARPVVGLLPLGLVCQLVAVPARIHLAPIQHRYAPPATCRRAKPPRALPA